MMFSKRTYCLNWNINAFRYLFSEVNDLMPKRTDCVITDVINFNIDIHQKHTHNLFSKANDVWFLCKTNLGRFALVCF
jgi:hypothetical protein